MESPYLNALPSALIAVDRALKVTYMNPAAESLLATSAQQAISQPLDSLGSITTQLCNLCERAFTANENISLFEHTLTLGGEEVLANISLSPVFDLPNHQKNPTTTQILISIDKAEGLDRLVANASKKEITRVAGVMAAMLAHEVKNPLSGIRGAAQLLHDDLGEEQQIITDLICNESDRIRDLLNQVEIFGSDAPITKEAVNIHEILQYVISVAQTGFRTDVLFKENYDPSLPEVDSHRDLLLQMLLNIVKNATEALNGQDNATITFSTSYRSGYHIQTADKDTTISLPIVIRIEDNGPGIPEDVRHQLFEPFVSSKEGGRGLGLAIVAKIASDLGAVVELDDSCREGTAFMILLPTAQAA